jgi:membrane fusion protein (multidrug efflux system)
MTQQVSSGQLKVPGSRSTNGSLGFTAQVKLADGSIYPRSGKLNFASEKVNPQTGSFDVRAEIPNPDGSLRPGQFVRVLLTGASRPDSISVPQRAVVDSPFGKIVFVVNAENKLEPHPVELEGWTKGNWIVTKGLKAGDRILVEGFIKAHDPGMTVKPVPYVPQAPGAQPGSAAAGTPPQAAAANATGSAASAPAAAPAAAASK